MQIAEYAHSALNKLPRHRRTKILTALSDLKSIVFLMVERSPDGTWTYHLDERCEDQVLPALCAVLSMSPDEVGQKAALARAIAWHMRMKRSGFLSTSCCFASPFAAGSWVPARAEPGHAGHHPCSTPDDCGLAGQWGDS